MPTNELVLFESQDKSISLNVPLKNDSVWLNRNQMAELFDRDVKTIGKHVNSAIREELAGLPVVANLRQLPLTAKLTWLTTMIWMLLSRLVTGLSLSGVWNFGNGQTESCGNT